MFHVYETNKSETENVERDFFFSLQRKQVTFHFIFPAQNRKETLKRSVSESGAVCVPWNRDHMGFGYGLR